MRRFNSYNKIITAFLRSLEFKFIKILVVILSPHTKDILCELVKLLIFTANGHTYYFGLMAVLF